MDPLARALAYSWALAEATSDEAVRFDRGTVLRSPSLPEAWTANAVRFERPEPDLTLSGLEALADPLVATPYLHATLEDEPTALRLLDEARAAGWKTDRELLMVLESTPEAPTVPVRAGTHEEARTLLRAWLVEEGQSEVAVENLIQRIDREHAALPTEVFIAEHEGELGAMALARYGRDGDVANVEDVYAIPAARGTGLGRAVTAAAARHAAERNTEVIFICADDADWPKELYAKLGFVPRARRAQLHRA